LREIFFSIALLAAATVVLEQHGQLSDERASLSRYESVRIPTSLVADQFRIITQTILDTDHVKVVKYRLESIDKHFATLEEQSDSTGGGSNGCVSSRDRNTNLHFTEVTVLIDHVASQSCVKVLPKVGGASGYSVASVQDDYVLDDETTINHVDGVYSRSETVELFQWDGKPFTLSLK
jgi:hypothetical protein